LSSQAVSNKERFRRLTQFLPVFNAPAFKAGEWIESKQGSDEIFSTPWVSYSPEVEKFIKACYEDKVILGFRWPAWGEKAEAFYRNPGLLEKASLLTLRRLLTFHLRKDRFCDGHLLDMFESGHIARILQRATSICEKDQKEEE
jgi:hypothetical protein